MTAKAPVLSAQALALLHGSAFDDGWSAQTFAKYLTDPAVIIVAKPQAMAVVRCAADEAEVMTLASAPTVRRAGHARAVLVEALRQAQAKGAVRVFLEVAEGNAAAQGLYLALGFQTVASRKDYYRHPDGSRATALIMTRSLDAAEPPIC